MMRREGGKEHTVGSICQSCCNSICISTHLQSSHCHTCPQLELSSNLRKAGFSNSARSTQNKVKTAYLIYWYWAASLQCKLP